MRLGNVTASNSQTFTLTHVPQFVGIRFGATGTLQSIQITTDVDGLVCNLTGDAVKAICQTNVYSELEATTDVFFIPVCDGELQGRACNITVNAGVGVGGVDVYDTSVRQSTTQVMLNNIIMDVIANGSAKFDKFTKLCVLNMQSTDVLTANSAIGSTSMQLTSEELLSMGSFYYNNSANVSVVINTEQIVQSVVFSPSANRSVVKQYFSCNGAVDKRQIEAVITQRVQEEKNLQRVAERGVRQLGTGIQKR
jgi:hypothetical protein